MPNSAGPSQRPKMAVKSKASADDAAWPVSKKNAFRVSRRLGDSEAFTAEIVVLFIPVLRARQARSCVSTFASAVVISQSKSSEGPFQLACF